MAATLAISVVARTAGVRDHPVGFTTRNSLLYLLLLLSHVLLLGLRGLLRLLLSRVLALLAHDLLILLVQCHAVVVIARSQVA